MHVHHFEASMRSLPVVTAAGGPAGSLAPSTESRESMERSIDARDHATAALSSSDGFPWPCHTLRGTMVGVDGGLYVRFLPGWKNVQYAAAGRTSGGALVFGVVCLMGAFSYLVACVVFEVWEPLSAR